MKKWKSKLLGDNSMNFYNWLLTGLFLMGLSCYYVTRAIDAEDTMSSQTAMLIAIYLILLGHFGVSLHTYCARVAEKLDAQQDEDTHAPTEASGAKP